uniref:Uncharacterized protein n=1 Tax=Strigamia maritima TaxID=126957 RepID=T1JL19_STRMM
MLAIYTDVHSHWPKYLNEFAFASRTQVSEALGHTPMLLNTGREDPYLSILEYYITGYPLTKINPKSMLKNYSMY